jgi:hypothetical protein
MNNARSMAAMGALMLVLFCFLAFPLFSVATENGAVRSRDSLFHNDTGNNNTGNNYTGSVSCRKCHEKFYQLWAPSHHGLAMQPLFHS